jgi:hypothetical protein
VVNGYLSHYLVEFDGTTLVGVTRGKDTVLLDANGVYGSRDEANASITKEFTEIYKREIPERMRGFDEEPWEVYMDDNTFSPVIVAPTLEEADPDNPYRSGEEAVNQIVAFIGTVDLTIPAGELPGSAFHARAWGIRPKARKKRYRR